MKRADPFYQTKRWEGLRKSAMLRDAYKCQSCKLKQRATQATCVHHIFPRDSFPQYETELWNLMSLCDKCHNEMHDRFTKGLSHKGKVFMRAKASEQKIKLTTKKETILVVGLAGSGKTTLAKERMGADAICYDLDAIAAAFRLREPHEENHKPARDMANDFLQGFIVKAHDYAAKVYIIRTAPSEEEFERINPTSVVVCKGQHTQRFMDDPDAARGRIKEIEKRCERFGVPCDVVF